MNIERCEHEVRMLQDMLGDEVIVTLHECDKGNNIIMHGAIVANKNSKNQPSPIYYFNLDEECEADAKRIVKLHHKTISETPAIDVSWFDDYEKAKERLILRLSSNPPQGVVSKPAFADLYMTACVRLDEVEGVINIKEENLKHWGINVDMLFKDARQYAKQNAPFVYKSLGMICQEVNPFGPVPKTIEDILILTTSCSQYGAAAILYAELPEEFYMIPSSIHEVLLYPIPQNKAQESELTSMVQFVNKTEVSPEDILADHAYHYSKGNWRIIA